MNHTPIRPIYYAICPPAIAPTIAPTFDKEPNTKTETQTHQISPKFTLKKNPKLINKYQNRK